MSEKQQSTVEKAVKWGVLGGLLLVVAGSMIPVVASILHLPKKL